MKRTLILAIFTLFSFSVSAETYDIDAAHSSVGFKIRHLAISTVPGSFGEFTGTFNFDPKNIEKSSTKAEISLESINTNNEKRDKHLRNEDFFDVEKYKLMKFVSRSVKKTDDDTFQVIGDLTIKDVTKPVTLDVEYLGAAKDPWGNEKAGFSATTKIQRKDFGLTYNKVLETGGFVIGDEVKITLDIQGVKQKKKAS